MAHPFFGEEFTFTQPDGSLLNVRGWGDADRAMFETLDEYTLMLEPVTGFYQYARASADGTELEPSGVAPGPIDPRNLGLKEREYERVRPGGTQAAVGIRSGLSRWETRRERTKMMKLAENLLIAPPSRQTVGDYVGLCLLVQFPDVLGTISRDEVEAFCNQQGYRGFGNNGSVYEYFLDNSVGKLRYTTIVAPYYTARHPRAYYTNPDVPYTQRARELIREALAHHVDNGFDFSRLTVDDGGYVFATNVFYAGTRVNNWSQGLWPHAYHLRNPYRLAAGVHAYDYQITDMTDALALGTYCHENGHLLCDFPDLYDKGDPGIKSFGIGAYCLMSGGGNADRRNPTQVSAYLKHQAGWANSVTTIPPNLSATARAGTNDFFIRVNNPQEYFIIENRHKSGRDSALPDSGLAIWHVDLRGNNSNEQMTPASHFECSLEQADGEFDLERRQGSSAGDNKDLFHAGWRDRFADSTQPSSKWWDGTPSGLDVHNISSAGAQMTFSANT